jgi:N-methylhydantoinase A/oxoprolinase/acetone carboxylase beta subunit
MSARAGTPMELISFRVEATRPTTRPVLAAVDSAYSAPDAPRTRQVYLRETGFVDCAIVDFRTIAPGAALAGPAIVERDTTTVWIPPGCSAEMDDLGNISIRLGAAP